MPDLRVVGYVEREAYAAAVLLARMEDEALESAPVYCGDLREFPAAEFHGCVDIVSAGYPCQPFSVAGKRKGREDERHLWPHVAEIIRAVEPAAVFLENVSGHLRLGFCEVASELRGMGYRVAAGLYSAEEVGASHRRQRLFCLAYDERRGLPEFWPTLDDDRRDASRDDVDRRNSSVAHGVSAGDDGEECSAAERGCGTVGDAENNHGGRRKRRTQAGTRENGERGRGSAGTGRTLADAERPDLQVSPTGRTHREGRGTSTGSGDELPLFPPGPADLDAWAAILGQWPQVEPAVCRVADGLANRLDRLRACGNGVVPLQAAYAFLVLRDALEA